MSSSSGTVSTVDNATSSRTSDHLSPLTTAERALLIEHEGCFKCCHFYTYHKSADCPDGFPNKSSYVPLTEVHALATKKKSVKKEKNPVMTVMTPAAVVMPSAVLGDGSDSEYINTPFFTPHFFFNCSVGGSTATSTESIRALIDHGCDAVLISPELADRLQLHRRKLPIPKEVVMAVGNVKETFMFTEWVPVTVISSDQGWTSCISHAIWHPIFAFLFFWVALFSL
jgi:hypothetical protein